MTLRQIIAVWLNFWFAPTSPVPLALFRICFGLLVFIYEIVLVGSDSVQWYGYRAVVSVDTINEFFWHNMPHLDIVSFFPHTDTAVYYSWCVLVLSSVFVTVGFFTRFSSVVLALLLISLHHREPFCNNGGDSMLRIYCVYMCFAPSGDAISVDRLIKRWRCPTLGAAALPAPISILSVRLIQVNLSLAYGVLTLFKLSGPDWFDCVAVYYSVRYQSLFNYRVSALTDNLMMTKVLSIFTLIAEGSMGTVVWIRDLRYLALLMVFVLHAGIALLLSIPVFEAVFVIGLVPFIYPEDLSWLMNSIKRLIERRFGPPIQLVYAPQIAWHRSLSSVIEGLDIFSRLSIVADPAVQKLTARTGGTDCHGMSLASLLCARLPLLMPFYPFLLLTRFASPVSAA